MDNSQLISRIASSMQIEQSEVESLVDALAIALRENAVAGNTVAIPGFGNITPVKHPESLTTDRVTGSRVLFPPEIALEFQPGGMLKKRVKNG